MANLAQIGRCVLVAVLLTACGQWEDQNRAQTVAREVLECFAVEVARVEPHRFHATGCERHADIVCSEGALEPVCIRVRERGVAADDDEEEADDDDTFVPDAYTIEEVEPDPLADDEAPDDEHGAVRTSGGEASAAEGAIRRGLDARAEDVFSCVDRDRVTVRVTHHADGTVMVALTGDLAGSPEEGCVRSALGDVRAPSGASGVVLHLLRRRTPVEEEPEPEPLAPAPTPSEPATGV